jgi:hypothetical protein
MPDGCFTLYLLKGELIKVCNGTGSSPVDCFACTDMHCETRMCSWRLIFVDDRMLRSVEFDLLAVLFCVVQNLIVRC